MSGGYLLDGAYSLPKLKEVLKLCEQLGDDIPMVDHTKFRARSGFVDEDAYIAVLKKALEEKALNARTV